MVELIGSGEEMQSWEAVVALKRGMCLSLNRPTSSTRNDLPLFPEYG